MTSPGRRKKHGLATEKRPGGGLRQPSQKTWVTVAKNTTDAENTPYRCKKHGRPSQKTCPPTRTVAKNARHRCKKHLPQEPWQKTRKLATVAKNMSYRRKKHATLNTPIYKPFSWPSGRGYHNPILRALMNHVYPSFGSPCSKKAQKTSFHWLGY